MSRADEPLPSGAQGEPEVILPASARALLESDKHAFAITTNRDGTPQASLIWVGLEGNEIVFNADTRYLKTRNLRRNLTVVIAVQDTDRAPTGHQQHLIVRGRVRLEGPGIPDAYVALTDKYTRRYWGPGKETPRKGAEYGVIVHVTPTRIGGIGPWAPPPLSRRKRRESEDR